MENQYCLLGTAYSCPYLLRCEKEGRQAVMIAKIPLNAFNPKRKHFAWNNISRGERITCLVRMVSCKDFPDLTEEILEWEENENEVMFIKRMSR
jgi:hypothetical protein